jgi:hypothetical protein
MATLAAFISNAILKVSTDPTYTGIEYTTGEEARIAFTNELLFELGLAPKPSAAHATVPVVQEEKPKKKRAAKASKETVVAEAAVAILEQVKEAPKEVEALAETLGQLALEEQPKAKKAKKAAEPTVGSNAAAGAEPVPEPVKTEKKKPGPKPKAKVEGAGNLEKLTPTHKKHIKAIAAELKVEANEKEFLTYANDMTAEEWGAKALDAHIRDFLQPEGGAKLAPAPKEFHEVEFKGKDYLVDPETKFVYTASASPTVKARSHVGVVGLLEFKEMEI